MDERVDLTEALPRLGWAAARSDLLKLAGRREVDRALRAGRITPVARGRYGLAESLAPAELAAVRVNGVISHVSAALRWGIAVKEPPRLPVVTVPHGRKLSSGRRRAVRVYWSDLAESEIDRGVTTPLRTVLDCAARLPFADALVVADSALRLGLVHADELIARAHCAPHQFRARVRLVALHADPRPQSALESLIRGYAVGIPGLLLVPQQLVAGRHPDLYDERLRLVVECESFEFHSSRQALTRDCVRYNDFALEDISVLRFAWEHAMHGQDYVRRTLATAVTARERHLGL